MKYSNLVILVGFIILISCSSKKNEDSIPVGNEAFPIEDGGYDIRNTEVREALHSGLIAKASKLESIPASALPIITLGYEGPGPDETAARVLGGMEDSIEISDRGPSLIAELGDDVFFTRKASGFFGYFNRSRLHRFPSVRAIEKEDLVNIALNFIVSKGFLSLVSGEELTVENVGTIRSATYDATDPTGPVLDGEAIMGYTVIFGRTFKEIPVIGSQIRVDINTDGTVQGFNNLMRPIVSAGEDVPILDDDEMRGKIEEEKLIRHLPENFKIRDISCGYIEAGESSMQGFLQPGCYAILTSGQPWEGIQVLVSATEHLAEPLFGEKVEYPLPEPIHSTSLDPDDLL